MATQVHVYFYLHLIYNKSPSFENYNKNTNQFYLIQHFIIVSLKYEHTISIKGKTYDATNSLQYKDLKYLICSSPGDHQRSVEQNEGSFKGFKVVLNVGWWKLSQFFAPSWTCELNYSH